MNLWVSIREIKDRQFLLELIDKAINLQKITSLFSVEPAPFPPYYQETIDKEQKEEEKCSLSFAT